MARLEQPTWQSIVGSLKELQVAGQPDGGLQPAANRKPGPESSGHRKRVLAATWISVKMDFSAVKPSDENIALTKPWLQRWDTEQRTLLSRELRTAKQRTLPNDHTHDPQKLRESMYVLFYICDNIFM